MAKQPRYLSGQVAAITGGARGIGRCTAQALIREGVRVAIGDLDLATAQKTAEELGGGTLAFPVNVIDRESFAGFLDQVEQQLGPVDVLVNNAGIMQLGPFVEEDEATQVRQVDINIHGVLHGMKLVLPKMVARRSGHIINLASTAGKAGFAGAATYCATKHAVIGASESIRAELRGTNVEITCIMPGLVNTELASGVQQARAIKNAEPEEVAAAIVDALKEPKFDVFVPRSIGQINKAMSVLPRGGREAISRFFKADRLLLDFDQSRRSSYELRASQSQAGLEPGSEQAALPQGAPGNGTPDEQSVTKPG